MPLRIRNYAYVLAGALQIYKLIPVKKVTDLSGAPFVARELMLVKVSRNFHA